MSEVKKTIKRIGEKDMIALIENIVKEAVKKEKSLWLAEQKANQDTLTEQRILDKVIEAIAKK